MKLKEQVISYIYLIDIIFTSLIKSSMAWECENENSYALLVKV